jgi:hypothetical protein
MKRDLNTIVSIIANLIPEDLSYIKEDLLSLQTSIDYCPPESIGHYWKQLSVILHNSVPKERLLEPWTLAISSVVTDSPLEIISKKMIEHVNGN